MILQQAEKWKVEEREKERDPSNVDLNSWFTSGTEVAIAQSHGVRLNALVNEFYRRYGCANKQPEPVAAENRAASVDSPLWSQLSSIVKYSIISYITINTTCDVAINLENEKNSVSVHIIYV